MNNQITQAKIALKRIEILEGKKDELIGKIQNFFDERGNAGKKRVPVNFNTQLQNLVRLAEGTTSVKEICLFIHYQMSKENLKENNKWKWRQGANGDGVTGSLGEGLIKLIQDIVKDTENENIKPIEAVRMFLGYFHREAVWQDRLYNYNSDDTGEPEAGAEPEENEEQGGDEGE